VELGAELWLQLTYFFAAQLMNPLLMLRYCVLQQALKMFEIAAIPRMRHDDTAALLEIHINASVLLQLGQQFRPPRQRRQTPIKNLPLTTGHFAIRRNHRRGDSRSRRTRILSVTIE